MPITSTYIRDIYQTRAGLEGMAALLATANIPARQLEAFQHQFESYEPELAEGQFTSYFDAGERFHALLVSHCGNQYLGRLLQGMHKHVARIRAYFESRPDVQIIAGHHEHLEILGALRSRNARLAKDLIEAHVLEAGDRLVALLALQSEDERSSHGHV
jgi:DNA-binding GntR family transcriptional regulator